MNNLTELGALLYQKDRQKDDYKTLIVPIVLITLFLGGIIIYCLLKGLIFQAILTFAFPLIAVLYGIKHFSNSAPQVAIYEHGVVVLRKNQILRTFTYPELTAYTTCQEFKILGEMPRTVYMGYLYLVCDRYLIASPLCEEADELDRIFSRIKWHHPSFEIHSDRHEEWIYRKYNYMKY